MNTHDIDLFVIGAGSGGVRAARMAASMGLKVVIAESQHLGGTCVNVGCVPKKLMVYAAHFNEDFAAAKGFGWTLSTPQFNWAQLMAQKNDEINRLQNVYGNLLTISGVEVVTGKAILIDAHTVQINNIRYQCKNILIATGGKPLIPDIPGREFIKTSNEMFSLSQLPQSIVIVGGGYIAVEFAGIMHGLGVKTTLCYRGQQLLRGFDEDIRDFVAHEMIKKGIDIRFNTDISHIETANNHYQVHTVDSDILTADLVLYATGRTPNTDGLQLEKVGVELDQNGAIKVDNTYQSSVASIYALGDVTNRFNLTPVATAEAMAFVNQLVGNTVTPVDYDLIPTAVFSQPNVATVGLTEAAARARYTDIDVYKSTFTAMKHTLSGLGEKTLVKMIVNRENDKVLGVHMVGADAGEIIQGMAVALKAGATKAIFDATIGIHPTVAEEFVTLRTPVAH